MQSIRRASLSATHKSRRALLEQIDFCRVLPPLTILDGVHAMTLLKSSACAVEASGAHAIAPAHAAEDGRTKDLGPWKIETIHKIEKIDRCTINRPVQDGIVARFVRTDAGLTLELESPNWKLERGKDYPVKMSVGSLSFNAQVAAESHSVSMEIEDKKFESALRNASALNIIAAGATIRVPLDQSAVAFDALAQCVADKSDTVAANIFCGDATSATASGTREGKSGECRQDAGATEETSKAEDSKPAEDTKSAEDVKPAEDIKHLRRVKSKKFRSRPIPAFFAEMFDTPLR